MKKAGRGSPVESRPVAQSLIGCCGSSCEPLAICCGEIFDHRWGKDKCVCREYLLPLLHVHSTGGGGLHSSPQQNTHRGGTGVTSHPPHEAYVCVICSCWRSSVCRWDTGDLDQENVNGGAPEGGSAS